jgi:hypothetical protein
VQFAGCLFDNGQTDAGALVLFPDVEPLEHAEDLLVVARVNPNAVIAHEQFTLLISNRPPTEFDALAGGSVELDRVVNEVQKDLPEQDRFN